MRGNKEPRKPNWKTIGKTNVLNCVQFLTRVPDRYHLIDLEEFLSNDHNEPQKILQINFFFLCFWRTVSLCEISKRILYFQYSSSWFQSWVLRETLLKHLPYFNEILSDLNSYLASVKNGWNKCTLTVSRP